MLHGIDDAINKNENFVLNIYEKFLAHKDYAVTVKEISKILQLSLKSLPDLVSSFQAFWISHSRARTFSDFKSVISGWILENRLQTVSNLNTQKNYLSYLKNLTRYYNRIYNDLSSSDAIMLKSCFSEIKEYYHYFSEVYPKKSPKLIFRSFVLDKEKEGLKRVFKFYAVQHSFVGKSPTFDRMCQQNNLWDLGVFLIFINNFCIIPESKEKRKSEKLTFIQFFKKYSHSKMTFSSFLLCLEDIANRFIVFRRPNFLFETIKEDPKIYLYEHMRLADFSYLTKKLKTFNQDFKNNEKITRPPSAISTYKFFLNEEISKKLKIYKESKISDKSEIVKKSPKKSQTRVSSVTSLNKYLKKKQIQLERGVKSRSQSRIIYYNPIS